MSSDDNTHPPVVVESQEPTPHAPPPEYEASTEPTEPTESTETTEATENTEPLPAYVEGDLSGVRMLPAFIEDDDSGIHTLPAYMDPEFSNIQRFWRNQTGIADSLPRYALDVETWREYLEIYPDLTGPWEERGGEEKLLVLSSLYLAIEKGKEDVIAFLMENGIITPSTKWERETPLLWAVAKKNVKVVQQLLDFGVDKDELGCVSGYFDGDEGWVYVLRTALQHAASLGHIVLVKLLMEQYHCDDTIVAPDGQTALRLAAENGHYDVVDYLPMRRLGGFQRWRHVHRKAIRRAGKAIRNIGAFLEFIFWTVPKFFLWDIPKHTVIKPIAKSCSWCWKNRKRFGPWCKRTLKKVPEVAARVGKSVGRGLAKTPKLLTDLAKWIGRMLAKVPGKILSILKDCWEFLTQDVPRWIKKFSKWLWNMLTVRLPKALGILAQWLSGIATSSAKAIWNVVLKIASFFSTVVEAIISALRRVTLADIWNGFVEVLKAVFVAFPKMVVSWIGSLGETSYKMMKALFGLTGKLIWWIGYGIGWVILYIPEQLWKIVKSLGESFAKATYEFKVWLNPKAR